jgi:hypothetical protein
MPDFQEFPSGKASFTLFKVSVTLSLILSQGGFLLKVAVSPPFSEKDMAVRCRNHTRGKSGFTSISHADHNWKKITFRTTVKPYSIGVDSASNSNEYQEFFVGVKTAGA